MPKLIVNEGGKSGEKVFSLQAETTIGRLPENTVPLKGSGVSREHAKIVFEENQYYLLDLGSGNGTLLNGIQLQANEKNLLRNNDRITIDTTHLKFWETDEIFKEKLEEEEEVTNADILEIKLLKKVLDAVDQETLPSLEILNGSQEGKRFFLTDDMQEITIGRDTTADFSILEDVISRQHARIVKKWGGIALIDLASRNGSYINNKRVTEEFLHDGDRVALGTILLLFRNPKEIDVKQLSEEISKRHPPLKPPPQMSPAEETNSQEAEEILKGLPSLKPASANAYPVPRLREKQMTSLEIGMIGLGIIVFAFATITLVNLILE